MRIAFVSDSIPPYNTGGKETRIFELTRRLVEMGHEVHVFTMHWWDTPETSRIENGVHLHAISRLYPLYSGERRSIWQGIMFSLGCFKLLKYNFDCLDVDHIPYFPLFVVRLVALLKRRPMYATWHEVWGRDYWLKYLGAKGHLAWLIERASMAMPSRILAVSSMTQARLHEVLGADAPISLVANGLDTKRVKAIQPAQHGADIIFSGRLLEHKHVDMLVRAMKLLHHDRPDITCLIVGDGPERTKLEALTLELGLSQTITFAGFLPSHDEVLAQVKAARVFVLPSTREGFGISLLEALACGTPVVTINHTDNAARDLVTPATGRLAKLHARSIAQAVTKLLDNPLPAREVQAAALAYDWDTAASTLVNEYQAGLRTRPEYAA